MTPLGTFHTSNQYSCDKPVKLSPPSIAFGSGVLVNLVTSCLHLGSNVNLYCMKYSNNANNSTMFLLHTYYLQNTHHDFKQADLFLLFSVAIFHMMLVMVPHNIYINYLSIFLNRVLLCHTYIVVLQIKIIIFVFVAYRIRITHISYK
jgi:hypothetical protein